MKLLGLTPNLMVNDVDATLAWYHTHLGFETTATVPSPLPDKLQWGMASQGEVTLMFHEKENLREEFALLKHAEPGGSLTLFVLMTGIRSLYERLSAEIEVVNPLKKSFYGMWEFTIRDLNGYFLTLAERAEEEGPQYA